MCFLISIIYDYKKARGGNNYCLADLPSIIIVDLIDLPLEIVESLVFLENEKSNKSIKQRKRDRISDQPYFTISNDTQQSKLIHQFINISIFFPSISISFHQVQNLMKLDEKKSKF